MSPSSPPPEPRSSTLVPLRPSVPLATTQGTLALDLEPRREPPRFRVSPGSDAVVVPIEQRARRELEEWAQRFAQAAVEIVGGDRPASQLARWTSQEVYLDLQRRALLVARAGGHQPGLRRVQPVRPRVRSVHTCFVNPAVVESSVHIRYAERSRAVAARFERRKQAWVCTALEFA